VNKVTVLDLDFRPYAEAKLPSSFKYEKRDEELVEFYNDDAKKLNRESIAKIVDVYHENKLVAYYAYSSSEINSNHLLPGDKVAPYAHPAVKLGRLLVCSSMRGKGVGTAILQHLAKQALDVREKIPLRFLLVDSLPHAVGFYIRNGFIDSTIKRGQNRDLHLLYIDLNGIGM